MSLSLKQVAFSYGEKNVLDQVSIQLEMGLFYGILGPNGSGKTTLLDLLAGHRKPSTGTVHFCDRQISDYPRKQLATEMALVPQNFYVNFPFRVSEIVMMGRYPHMPRFAAPSAEDRQIVARVMSETQITEYADRFVTELSGGEKQRVVFARALAQDTKLLLLDEATSSMDIHHAIQMMNLVSTRVRSESLTAVAVMQDINLAAMYCQHLIFMKRGSIDCHGPTEQVLQPDTLRRVYEVESKVYDESFSECRQVVFKR